MAVSGYELAEYAASLKGSPFTWGGEDVATGTDTGSFVQKIFESRGIRVPRTTYNQINEGNKISRADLQPGDIVFFDTDRKRGGADHAGIYLGEGKFIHNSKPGKGAQVSNLLEGYYSERWMAARRPAGMLGGGTDSLNEDQRTNAPSPGSDELTARYGWSHSFLNANPELKNLTAQAVEEDWDEKRFKVEVKETNWWQENSETMRQTQLLANDDPATFAAQVQATTMKVRELAQEIGAIIPEGVMASLGEEALRTAMSEEQLRATMAQYITFTEEGTLAGTAGQAQIKLKQLAHLNGVSMSDQSIQNYAQQIALGVSTMEQAEQQVRNMAVSMFPAYEEQITAGMNVSDIASPYVQSLARELEIPATTLTLFDPRVKQALNGINDEGVPAGQTMTEFERSIRSSPEWLQTSRAQESVMRTGNQVLKNMGII